jgi:transposase InsO family protein
MNSHKGARLSPHSRALLVKRITQEGLRVEEAAHAAGVSMRTAYKWLRRYRDEGMTGLMNRSSKPHHSPHQTPVETIDRMVEQRKARQTYRQIAQEQGIAASTVGRWLQHLDLNRLASLEPAQPIRRYEHEAPGDLLHLDIKKLGRFWKPGHRVTGSPQHGKSYGAGWEHVHIAIDDHSRVSFACILPDESATSACKALLAALRYYRALGIHFRCVLTDNGGCYRSRKFRRLMKRLGLKHRRTRPYTPRTNGKAERFIQTALREWAYARSYDNSDQRAAHLNHWLHEYNWHRPHASVNYQPPMSRIPMALNNVLGLHT